MIKGLLNIDENLASSIALRYAGQLTDILSMQIQATHVEEPDAKQRSAGTGWVQRTWERGIEEAGMQTVLRLIKTENPNCNFIANPKIFVGDRDDEILEELRKGRYELFVEGNVNTSNVNDFYRLITSPLYSKSPCPMLVVKNLVVPKKGVILVGDGVDPQKLIAQFIKIAKTAKVDFDLVHYKFQENNELVFLDKREGGSYLADTESLLKENGFSVQSSKVICGTPEQAADSFREYGLAITTFPTRRSPRMEMLAHIPTPLILCR